MDGLQLTMERDGQSHGFRLRGGGGSRGQTCSCSSARRLARSSSESELGLLSLSLSLLSSLSDEEEEEEEEDEELGGGGGSSGILAKQNSKTSCEGKKNRQSPAGQLRRSDENDCFTCSFLAMATTSWSGGLYL